MWYIISNCVYVDTKQKTLVFSSAENNRYVICKDPLVTDVVGPPAPRKGSRYLDCHGGCRCYSWGWVHCHLTYSGCYCHGPAGNFPGGCQVEVPHGLHDHWCSAEDHRGAHCKCNYVASNKPVFCRSEPIV